MSMHWLRPLYLFSVRALLSTRGVAAAEFALILPIMLLIYFGSTQITMGVMASRKVTLLSRTIADLVAQQPAGTSLTDATMTSIFNAAAAVMTPFDITSLTMVVSAVDMVADTTAPSYNGYKAKIRWSATQGTGAVARSCQAMTPVANGSSPSSTTLPQGLYAAGSMVIADVGYTYTPGFGGAFLAWSSSAGFAMRNTAYMRPRNWTTYVTYPTKSTGSCTTY